MKFVTSFQIYNFSESPYSLMKLVTSLMIHFVTLMVTIFPNTTYPPILTTTPHTPSPSPTCEIIACCKDTASYQQVFPLNVDRITEPEVDSPQLPESSSSQTQPSHGRLCDPVHVTLITCCVLVKKHCSCNI